MPYNPGELRKQNLTSSKLWAISWETSGWLSAISHFPLGENQKAWVAQISRGRSASFSLRIYPQISAPLDTHRMVMDGIPLTLPDTTKLWKVSLLYQKIWKTDDMIYLHSKNKQKFYLNTSLCQGKVILISMIPTSPNLTVAPTPRIQHKYFYVLWMKVVMDESLASFTAINSQCVC